MTIHKVESVTLPPVQPDGFRRGFATATVDGQPRRIFTSRRAHPYPDEHLFDVRLLFGMGLGEPV